MESALTFHMAQHFLDTRFSSVKEMASSISVPYRALLRLFHHKNTWNDTQIIARAIAIYDMKEQISPETLYLRRSTEDR